MFWKRKPKQVRTESPPVRRCSFCNKSARDVAKLIAGPRIFICSECVEICQDILDQDRIVDPGKTPEDMDRDRKLYETGAAVLCGLCDNMTELKAMVQVPDRGWVCRKCVNAVSSIGTRNDV